ncbi:unnamed protein product, partial [Iphiclides podalirius]
MACPMFRDTLTILVFVSAIVHGICDGEVYDAEPSLSGERTANETGSGVLDELSIALDTSEGQTQSLGERGANGDLDGVKVATFGTGEATAIPQEAPDALGSKDQERATSSDYEYSRPEEGSEDGAVSAPTEATVPEGGDVTDGAPLSTVDNNVYRADADGDRSRLAESDADGAPTENPAAPLTTRAEEPEELLPEVEEEQPGAGQRSPKTDSADGKQSATDKRNNDARARSAPIASKSSTLRSWLEDPWLRPPAGLLVPLRPMALRRALDVWNDMMAAGALEMKDIVIVGFDANGVSWRSRHSLQPSGNGGDRTVADAISKLILKYQGVRTDSASDGTMRALGSAAKLVPYDSALFIITDKRAGDPQKLPLALRALVEKRLKVYTIWTDPRHPSEESELALQELRNVSTHTEGDVLPYSLQLTDLENGLPSEAELQQWEPLAEPLLPPVIGARRARLRQIEEDSLDTLLVWRGGGEAISLGIPVEAGVTALRVLIEGAVDHAALFPPNEAPQVDLYNLTSVQEFSPSSRTDRMTPRDVYLPFPGAPEVDMLSVVPVSPPSADVSNGLVGVWHLSVRCNSCDYRLTVSARAQVHFQAEAEADLLSLRVVGPVASIRESVLVDEYGSELAKLPFSYPPMTGDGPNDAGQMVDIEEDIPLPIVHGSKVYVKILGRNVQGNPFMRFSGPINQEVEVRNGRSAIAFPNDLERVEEENSAIYSNRLQFNDSNVLPFGQALSQVVNQRGVILTAVQIGLSTRLYGAPGDSRQLHFEVTNYREQAVRFNFGAVGELRFLRSIEPASQTVAAGQTVNVIVNLLITATAQPGARDLITFTAYGLDQVSISAYVYVVNAGDATTDTWPPEVRHNFQGSCIGRSGSDCSEHVWSATIIARDAIGGLLRMTSSPIGLTYESNFISGTREEVVATYRATCCAPRVIINAVDAFGNTNSYVVDITGYISGAGIAAIALGVLLFIALLGLIIFLIYWCVRRSKSSRELPTYTTSRNIS